MAPTVIIKTANAPCDVRDVKVDCDTMETVAALKNRITSCHPLKPAIIDQRLIFKGVCLQDAQVLKDVIRDNEDAVFHLALRAGAMSPMSSASAVQQNSGNASTDSRVRSASPRSLRRRRQLPSRQPAASTMAAEQQQPRYQQQHGGNAYDAYFAQWWQHAAPAAAGSAGPSTPPAAAAAAWTTSQDAAASQYYAAWYRYYYSMAPHPHAPGYHAQQASQTAANTAGAGSQHAFLQPYRPTPEQLDHHVQQLAQERPYYDTVQLRDDPMGRHAVAAAANNAHGHTNHHHHHHNNNNNDNHNNHDNGDNIAHARREGDAGANDDGIGGGEEEAAQRFAQAGAGAARAPGDNDQAVGNDGRMVRRGPVDVIWWFLKTAALLLLMGGNDPGRRVYSLVVAFSLIALHYFGAFQAVAAWIVRLQRQAEADQAQQAQGGDDQVEAPVEPPARPSLFGEIAAIFVTFFTSMLPLELMQEQTMQQPQQPQQQNGGDHVAAPQNNDADNNNNNNDGGNNNHANVEQAQQERPDEAPAEVAARA